MNEKFPPLYNKGALGSVYTLLKILIHNKDLQDIGYLD